jgi:hypothetical protein
MRFARKPGQHHMVIWRKENKISCELRANDKNFRFDFQCVRSCHSLNGREPFVWPREIIAAAP